jgi:hypothetical protein
VPYDLPAARQAAIIWQEARAGQPPVLPELCDEGGKQRVKVDIQILASAIARGASILYTQDAALRKLASRIESAKSIEAVEIPALVVQLRFGEED